MGQVDVWETIRREREALAADLASLSESQWTSPSLCSGWTIRDVLAHMTATAKMSPGRFVSKLVSNGFSLTKLQNRDIAVERGVSPEDGLARFRSIVGSTGHPPGPIDTWLGEAIVHAEDIRRPLGIAHDYPIAAVLQVADFYKKSNLIIGAKRRVAGLTLRATDAQWSTGSGPEVAGRAIALVSAMTGRKAALDDLDGDGVAVLRSRP